MPAPGFTKLARLQRPALLFLCTVFALLCLYKARLIGDGLEYLAMSQGIVAHGSPELRRSDIDAFKDMPPRPMARSHLQPDVMAAAHERVQRDGTIELGFARGKDGSVHAIHFWMYSLLAAPFYALVTLLGQNPFMALVALNLVILGVTAWRVRAWLPGSGMPEVALLVLMGPIYYAAWSGPEVMAGCCVLLATLAALRRDLPLAVALAGLGATQNPSIAGLILAAAAYAVLYRLFPATALFAAREGRRARWESAALIVAGILAACLPYLYNLAVFGVPSIIGRHFNDLSLVTPERLFSFLFDLNQGLFTGLPALVSTAAIILLRLDPQRRRWWLLHAGIALFLTLGMALPTLSATNWNSGAIIVSRYAYWTAMPLLALCFVGLVHLSARARMAALATALALQGVGAWQAYQSKTAGFTSHGKVAAWVLDHAPRYYNPDPEIFLERERHREYSSILDEVVVHRGPDGPTKLMRFWTNTLDAGGVCAAGTHLAAGHVVTLASGWRYYNAPLRCDPGPGPTQRIAIRQGMPPILGSGWSIIQETVVWTDGPRSTLLLPVPPGRRVRQIGLDGHYIRGVRATRVSINGSALGSLALGTTPLNVPDVLRSAPVLELTLEHTVTEANGNPGDPRKLGFSLRGVFMEFER